MIHAAWAQFEFATPGRLWWTVLILLVWLLVIGGGVFVLIRILSARSPELSQPREGRSRLQVLRERFRQGRVDRDMYRGVVEGEDSVNPGSEDEEEKEEREDEEDGKHEEDDEDEEHEEGKSGHGKRE